ncbi:MAG: bleomycin resistance protein [Actinomycetota bacterium]|nr:bleomycin resistance protein [Actinomycetota bacterium]
MDVDALSELLREAEEHHGPYEASAPKHHWSDFYAAYVVARDQGRSAEEADQEARRHMDDVLARQGAGE